MAIDPKDNVSKKLVAFPYDKNNKPSSVLLLPIVENNEVIGYLPAKATSNGDGTATLDITGGGGGGIDPVGLKNIAAVTINPSTEDTLALLEAKDFATQTTLALIKAQTDKLIFTGNDLNVVDSAAAGTTGVAEHHNGTATTTPANVPFSGTSKAILIDNLDASKNLLVSFDGGANTKIVLPGQSLSIEANHTSVDVSSSAGTVAFEMLVTV